MEKYSWNGRGKNLVKGAAVDSFAIRTAQVQDGCVYVTGDLGIVDDTATDDKKRHMTVTWYASSHLSDGEPTDWLVRKSEKEVRFARGYIHDALCVFIRSELVACFEANRLSALISALSSSPKPVADADSLEALGEPLPPHKKTCVCGEIYGSNIHRPFQSQWRDGSAGFTCPNGAYRCVLCDCGEKWWQIRPEFARWVRVVDELSWLAILAHKGSPPKGLVRTMLDTAFIPGPDNHAFDRIPIVVPA